ncbi:MAG: hypothetical protein DI563_06175 [Variovorax paradoxus]|uniref:Lipoprotein n=1 Tax=Variovorax paradoxus TaxID=34073 RepID=A0A2W5QI13_VARPD|nr:MAG: hypothetical protein DI563_06175 [Variovorax paradoxus]
MKHTQRLALAATILALAASLSACGGGGGGGGYAYYPIPPGSTAPPGNDNGGGTPPVEVSAYDAFLALVVALVATKLDNEEPVNVARFDPAPTSETADPLPTP